MSKKPKDSEDIAEFRYMVSPPEWAKHHQWFPFYFYKRVIYPPFYNIPERFEGFIPTLIYDIFRPIIIKSQQGKEHVKFINELLDENPSLRFEPGGVFDYDPDTFLVRAENSETANETIEKFIQRCENYIRKHHPKRRIKYAPSDNTNQTGAIYGIISQ